ncbi:MAG: thioredoxin family protein [Methylotenera sp.]
MVIKDTDGITELNRTDIDALKGAALLEFGAVWCGYCKAAQPIIASALVNYPNTYHIKIEDGKGRRLGRLYSVKLWPTLIFLRDGIEINRLVRPVNLEVINEALAEINIE